VPNNYAIVITGHADSDKFDAAMFNLAHRETDLCRMVCPMPDDVKNSTDDAQCDWATAHWGTKWGCFDMVAQPIMGDGCPVCITLKCAWRPPKPQVMRLIVAWLSLNIGLESPVIVGLNPFDGTSVILWDESKKPTIARLTGEAGT
jgi:hypothetical protein